jgi:hypothetical protein
MTFSFNKMLWGAIAEPSAEATVLVEKLTVSTAAAASDDNNNSLFGSLTV